MIAAMSTLVFIRPSHRVTHVRTESLILHDVREPYRRQPTKKAWLSPCLNVLLLQPLPCAQRDLIDPLTVCRVVTITVNLHRHIQFAYAARSCVIRLVEVALLPVQRDSYKLHLAVHPLEFQSQMIPCISRRRSARDSGPHP